MKQVKEFVYPESVFTSDGKFTQGVEKRRPELQELRAP